MYNKEFQVIDTQSKAYFLGLFMADGCISNNSVRISLIDKEIIETLHTKFPFFNKGSFDFGKYNSNSKVQYSLAIKSNELRDDLTLYNIYPRKSTNNKNCLCVPNIKEKAISHFIRGYFDGNGSISIPSVRPNLRRVEICSTSKSLIESIKEVLESNNINCPIYREKNQKVPLYVLEWVNTTDIINLREYMYRNSNFHINRKKELFDSFIPIIRGEGNPICECGGTLMKNGKRVTKHIVYTRYKCKKCNKNTQLPCPHKIG